MLWLAFVIAGIIAGLTAFSYAKLSSRFPKEAAECVYLLKATNKRGLAFFGGYISLLTTIFSIATVAYGFASYFKLFFDLPAVFVCAALIIILSLINLLGIQKSMKFNIVMTIISILGLSAVIIVGLPFISGTNLLAGLNGELVTSNLSSLGLTLFPAVALIFFAYLGFEELANISEEIRDPKKNLPIAIIASLAISTIIYILISIVSVSVVPAASLAAAANPSVPLTQGPLALVAETALPGMGYWLSIVALCTTASTLLALLVVASRILYGMGEQNLLPKILFKTNNKTHTPHYAVLLVMLIAVIFSSIGNLQTLGNLSTLGVFLLFFLTHISLIMINLRESKHAFTHEKHFWRVFYPPAVLGALFCGGMFITQYWWNVNFFGIEIPLIIFASAVFLTAVPVYYLFSKELNNTFNHLETKAAHNHAHQAKKRRFAYN
ncbi:Amino acid permease [uncultured archaeon]|nr:Amino acid permease [uncultured archaeon]